MEFFRFGQVSLNLARTFAVYHEKKKEVCCCVFKVSIDCLEKKSIVLEKKPGKSLKFLIQKSVRTLVLGTGYMCFLQTLIGSLNCFRLL